MATKIDNLKRYFQQLRKENIDANKEWPWQQKLSGLYRLVGKKAGEIDNSCTRSFLQAVNSDHSNPVLKSEELLTGEELSTAIKMANDKKEKQKAQALIAWQQLQDYAKQVQNHKQAARHPLAFEVIAKSLSMETAEIRAGDDKMTAEELPNANENKQLIEKFNSIDLADAKGVPKGVSLKIRAGQPTYRVDKSIKRLLGSKMFDQGEVDNTIDHVAMSGATGISVTCSHAQGQRQFFDTALSRGMHCQIIDPSDNEENALLAKFSKWFEKREHSTSQVYLMNKFSRAMQQEYKNVDRLQQHNDYCGELYAKVLQNYFDKSELAKMMSLMPKQSLGYVMSQVAKDVDRYSEVAAAFVTGHYGKDYIEKVAASGNVKAATTAYQQLAVDIDNNGSSKWDQYSLEYPVNSLKQSPLALRNLAVLASSLNNSEQCQAVAKAAAKSYVSLPEGIKIDPKDDLQVAAYQAQRLKQTAFTMISVNESHREEFIDHYMQTVGEDIKASIHKAQTYDEKQQNEFFRIKDDAVNYSDLTAAEQKMRQHQVFVREMHSHASQLLQASRIVAPGFNENAQNATLAQAVKSICTQTDKSADEATKTAGEVLKEGEELAYSAGDLKANASKQLKEVLEVEMPFRSQRPLNQLLRNCAQQFKHQTQQEPDYHAEQRRVPVGPGS